ncbi:MAG: PAS domain S-box protein [Candidatus Odinarchaeota archaeon]
MNESDLYQTEDVFKELFENINSAIVIYESINDGKDFIYKQLNRAALDRFRLSRKNVIDKNIIDIFPGLEEFGLINALRRVWKTGKSEHLPISLYKDERISGWTEMYIYKLPSENVVAIFEPMTKIVEKEQELKESKLKFSTLADQSLMGIYIIQENKMIYANQKLADTMGFDYEKLMNMNLEDQLMYVHPDDREFVKKQVIKKQKGKKDLMDKYEFRYLKPSGEILWIEIYSRTITYEGKPAYFVTFLDITEKKQMEDALQKSEYEKSVILESLLEHIIYQTTDNTILWVNKAAADSVNIKPKELIGRKCYQIWNALDEPCEGCPIKKCIISKKPETTEMTAPDGRIWLVSGYPVKDNDNNVISVVESTLNITEKKTAEKKVKNSEKKYKKAYYQANLYKDIFAHDINNILQNISSSVELSSLYLNNPEKLNTIKELYKIIDEQVNRAKKLIINIRKITEIDESEIVLEKIDTIALLNKAIEFIKNSFQTRNIDVQINTPIKKTDVIANNFLLDVFENILINAVRYNNKPNIEIIINISIEKKEDKNYLKIEFKDNGKGISDYRKNTIFERGLRKRYKTKGMGLGLSLVRKIMDTYKGDIWVEDRVKGDHKQGSNFIVLIPTNH